jgi:mevalonate kinase
LWQTPYFLPYLVGSHDSAVSTLAHEPLLETVNTGMHLYRVRSGQVNVHSELDQTFGLGSSSALRLGVLLAMRRLSTSCYESSADELQGYYARPNADWSAAINAFKLQKAAQKNASGYDIATQLQGGLVFFTPPLASAEPSWPNGLKNGTTSQQRSLNDLIHIYVGGSGAPTGIVMSDTIAWLDSEARWPMVQDLSVGLVEAFAVALHRGIDDEDALIHLYQAVQKSRQAFTASPHFPHSLAAKLEDVPGCDKSWSFKTTGAGGEDAVLLIGTHEALRAAKELMAAQGWGPLEAAFEQAGTRIQRTVTS